jgi:uncharacterized membrane protein YbhN (UPF0104 family)
LSGAGPDGRPGIAPSPELSRLRALFRAVLGTAALIFVGYACFRLFARWETGKVSVAWLPLALSALPLVAGAVILAWGWKWLVERMTSRAVPTRLALALHVESQLARYTPGKVGMPLVRIAGAPQLGVSGAAVGSSVLIEVLPFVSVGGAVGFLCLWVSFERAPGEIAGLGPVALAGFGAFALATLALTFLDRRRYPRRLLALLRAEGDAALVPASVPLAHAAYWLTWALHGYLVNLAVGVPHAAALAGVGFYVLAPIAGFLALVTPSGIGVREAVLSVGLAQAVGPAPALAAAIVSRGVSLLVDVLAWGAARFWGTRGSAV